MPPLTSAVRRTRSRRRALISKHACNDAPRLTPPCTGLMLATGRVAPRARCPWRQRLIEQLRHYEQVGYRSGHSPAAVFSSGFDRRGQTARDIANRHEARSRPLRASACHRHPGPRPDLARTRHAPPRHRPGTGSHGNPRSRPRRTAGLARRRGGWPGQRPASPHRDPHIVDGIGPERLRVVAIELRTVSPRSNRRPRSLHHARPIPAGTSPLAEPPRSAAAPCLKDRDGRGALRLEQPLL